MLTVLRHHVADRAALMTQPNITLYYTCTTAPVARQPDGTLTSNGIYIAFWGVFHNHTACVFPIECRWVLRVHKYSILNRTRFLLLQLHERRGQKFGLAIVHMGCPPSRVS